MVVVTLRGVGYPGGEYVHLLNSHQDLPQLQQDYRLRRRQVHAHVCTFSLPFPLPKKQKSQKGAGPPTVSQLVSQPAQHPLPSTYELNKIENKEFKKKRKKKWGI